MELIHRSSELSLNQWNVSIAYHPFKLLDGECSSVRMSKKSMLHLFGKARNWRRDSWAAKNAYMVRTPAVPTQYTAATGCSYPRRNASCKNEREDMQWSGCSQSPLSTLIPRKWLLHKVELEVNGIDYMMGSYGGIHLIATQINQD